MPDQTTRIREYLQGLLAQRPLEAIEQAMLPDDEDLSARLTAASRGDAAAVERRWRVLGEDHPAREVVLDEASRNALPAYAHAVENLIGTVRLPLGLAGPLRIRGVHAQGDFYVPMATSEAALVASSTRGAQVISRSGGCTAAVVHQAVTRTPAFLFDSLAAAGRFVLWVSEHTEALRQAAEATTRYGRLSDLRVHLEGNHVYLIFEYTTGDAAGQNMVTIATEAACQHAVAHAPVTPRRWYVEANLSGDKKATSTVMLGARGRKTVAEVTVPAGILKRLMHVTAEELCEYWRVSGIGGVMSGNIGIQGHYANALAAVFIACGQDAACVSEAAVGVTRFEPTDDGGLYASVTLPNLIVGSVGGGTGLPTARACLNILGLAGPGHANALAEVCAGLVLAGELSITAALTAHEFTEAHRRLARDRQPDPSTPHATGDGS